MICLCTAAPALNQLTLSTGAAVGITLTVSAVVFTILGVLIGFLLMYLTIRRRLMYSIADQQTNIQPATPVGTIYEGVSPAPKEEIELKSNQAYGPISTEKISN